ncbi:MAG: hypothetical protein LBT29_00670 [Flavobacteriaceae bacterium]|jgi:hypothetical protein|nr:hypothetical protein [Flavobacteriaceae bacterium]
MKQFITFASSVFLSAYIFAQVGINTETPKTELDVNGNITVRKMKNAENNNFTNYYGILSDEEGQFYRSSPEPISYSKYLGYEPMAAEHDFELPTTLKKGYITTITGVGIGACCGAPFTFTLTFKDSRLISGVIERTSVETGTGSYTTPGTVILSRNNVSDLTSKPIDNLDGKITCPASAYGHYMQINETTGKITVKFLDIPQFFPDAGTFSVTNVTKVKYK